MITRSDANLALEDFRRIVAAFEERPIGLGVVHTNGGWCLLMSRREKPEFASKLPKEVRGVPIISNFGSPPFLGNH